MSKKKGVVGDLTVSMAVIAITAVAWLLWDIVAYVYDYTTLSHYIVNWAWYSPMIPLITGILMGHWFWTKPQKEDDE